ncbi:unnamed protein product [Cuscuta campestris]|uniref:FLZ-type domain-containing protein n=1 Tax=Cuscuta campestris TaxID=132261 RepID=A0A484L1H6_9ASTE|nr:unnamed protein product [Cuscuta campestris]
MLGKRRSASFRRTTSMRGITVDGGSEAEHGQPPEEHAGGGKTAAGEGGHIETPNFLRTCGLCNRRLVPCRDIFMYRGDTAFCSQECREQKILQDERKEKSINKVKSGKNGV